MAFDQRSQHDLKAEGDGARLRSPCGPDPMTLEQDGRRLATLARASSIETWTSGPAFVFVMLKGGAQHAFVVSDPADGAADEEAAERGEIGLSQPPVLLHPRQPVCGVTPSRQRAPAARPRALRPARSLFARIALRMSIDARRSRRPSRLYSRSRDPGGYFQCADGACRRA